jgi:tetratricopeptide (TPR) repeat protein
MGKVWKKGARCAAFVVMTAALCASAGCAGMGGLPSPSASRDRGPGGKDTGQYDKAIADYTEALRLNPDDADERPILEWLLELLRDMGY